MKSEEIASALETTPSRFIDALETRIAAMRAIAERVGHQHAFRDSMQDAQRILSAFKSADQACHVWVCHHFVSFEGEIGEMRVFDSEEKAAAWCAGNDNAPGFDYREYEKLPLL